MRMGGRPAPFGVDEEDLDEVLDLILPPSILDFRGIHLFAGTQIYRSAGLSHAVPQGSFAIARKVAAEVAAAAANSGFRRGPLESPTFRMRRNSICPRCGMRWMPC